MRSLIISGLFVSFGLFLGRVSGFVREAFIASNFGASQQTDLIIIFLTTPDILVNLLVGGALGMTLIPEFKKLSTSEAVKLYQQVFIMLITMLSIFSIIAAFSSDKILSLFAPGLSAVTITEYSATFSITFIAIPLTVAAGVTTAFLHYQEKFLVPALGTLIFNLTVIVSLYFANQLPYGMVFITISIGVVIAAFLRWLNQAFNSKTLPIGLTSFSSHLITATLLRRYFYCVMASGIIFLIPVITRALASQFGKGELSITNYAIKLVEFPLGVVLTVFSIVYFPLFSKIFVKGNEQEFLRVFKQSLLSVLIISIAVFIPLHHFSNSVVYLIFDWGQLSQEQLKKIIYCFNYVSIALPFQGINALLIAVMAARRDTLSPLIISIPLVLLFIFVGYNLFSDINSILKLMVLTYIVLSIILFSVLIIKHKIKLLKNVTFILDLFKISLVTFLYYWLLSHVTATGENTIFELSLATISSILFISFFIFTSKETRKMIGNRIKVNHV